MRLRLFSPPGAEQAAALQDAVRNVQNVQKPAPVPAFEHFDQIEQRPENAAASAEPAWSEAEGGRAATLKMIAASRAHGLRGLPGPIPTVRPATFVDDVGRFLDGPFRAVAASLGWGPHNSFGCDRDRPYARIDQAGLLWLLDGNRRGAVRENRDDRDADRGAPDPSLAAATGPTLHAATVTPFATGVYDELYGLTLILRLRFNQAMTHVG